MQGLRTPLMIAPPGIRKDPFGAAIPSDDLIRGLRQINTEITVWSEHPANVWYPGKNTMSCLWVGDPGGESKKISAFHYGAIPEFTQLNPDGSIMIKGWRAIFASTIAAKAATQEQIERKFRVSLGTSLREDERCRLCVRQGKRHRRHNGGKRRLCSPHDQIQEAARGLLDKTRGF